MRNQKWWIKDKAKVKAVINKLDGLNDRYNRKSEKSILEFDAKTAENYQSAIIKGRGRLKTLSFEDAGKAIRLIMEFLEKEPDYNWNIVPRIGQNNPKRRTLRSSGRLMKCRKVFWGINLEDGIHLSNILVAAGVTEFKISPMSWLSINIPVTAYVSSFYYSDDPNEWKKKNDKRYAAHMAAEYVKAKAEDIDHDNKCCPYHFDLDYPMDEE